MINVNQIAQFATAPPTPRNLLVNFLRLTGTSQLLTPIGTPLYYLGSFVFSAGTAAPTTVSSTHSYRWNKQERVDRMPAMQAVGVGSNEVTMSGVIYTPLTRESDPLAPLRAMAAAMQPYALVDGGGHNLGLYVIEAVSETGTALRSDGKAREIKFTVSLRSYGADT